MDQQNVKREITKGAIISTFINGIINGVLNWYQHRDLKTMLLSDDMISSTARTVFAGAVPLAVSLAFIITSIAYFTFKYPNKPSYFPTVFGHALRNAFFAMGVIITGAILIQYYVGSIWVTPVQGGIIAGIIAGIVGGTVEYLTKMEIVHYAERMTYRR